MLGDGYVTSVSDGHRAFRKLDGLGKAKTLKGQNAKRLSDEVYPVTRELRPLRSSTEVASILGITPQAVIQTQNRALRKVIRAMREFAAMDEI